MLYKNSRTTVTTAMKGMAWLEENTLITFIQMIYTTTLIL